MAAAIPIINVASIGRTTGSSDGEAVEDSVGREEVDSIGVKVGGEVEL